jgi:hypothetical protein
MSNVRSNNFFDPTGNYGMKPSSDDGFTVSVLGWEFKDSGGSLYPVNKTKVVFNGTGADQSWTVPTGVSNIFVKMWGAGGGPGRASGWSYGANGGGGGHTRGLLSVTPGLVLTARVGSGGAAAIFANSYGGGGGASVNADVTYGGQGGGGTYLLNGTTPLLIAGGGGGGGTSRAWDGNIGGAGGGITGQRGESPYDGKANHAGTGGTQTAGGSSAGGANTVGALYTGGKPSTNSYGGGGGGGYYGGGGGSFSEANTMGGGGGGSGYVIPSAKVSGTFTGESRYPAFFWDNDLDVTTLSNQSLIAHGALNRQNAVSAGTISAGNGLVVIYY